MAAPPQSIRRRATVAALSPLLDEEALMEVLWLQHETQRGDQVSDLIAFVDAVARRHLFDGATVKKLYGELFRLQREPEDRLPFDPWPLMQAMRAQPTVPGAAPAAPAARAPAAAPVPVAPVIAPVAAAFAAARAAEVAATPLPAEPPVLFGALMCSLVAEVYQFHREALDEVRAEALGRLDAVELSAPLRQQYRTGWGRALQHDWQLPASADELARLVWLVHGALVDAFGAAGAQQILSRAMAAAEALPEATRFDPRGLLAVLGSGRR
ncbi:hypothetical protein C7444_12077 [Sphaerotilus hippei]|uniref:Uncharacterized protein n=1 Tax=Sphaerotilus hippei TaxID=744406 RepID=A0A318H6Z8_9BURK|nr:hypothetical protein [Sphaerotilus hippei]PXW93425.1 hypothetical protein C7444_12077 [Sphaerotilus hippei]